MRSPPEHPFVVNVKAPRAIFSVPHFLADPISWAYPTPSACGGILRALYWKPEVAWEIDEIHVHYTPRFASAGYRTLDNGAWKPESSRTIRTLTFLENVDFDIVARLVKNPLRNGYPWVKYVEETERRLASGQSFRQPVCGQAEFFADVTYLPNGVQRVTPPVTQDLGPYLYDLIPVDKKQDIMRPVYWRARIEDGVIRIPDHLHESVRLDRFKAIHAAHKDRKVESDTFTAASP